MEFYAVILTDKNSNKSPSLEEHNGQSNLSNTSRKHGYDFDHKTTWLRLMWSWSTAT